MEKFGKSPYVAKVWNDNTLPFTQEYNGTQYTIPAGKSIEMDLNEARAFLGAFYPMEFDGDGNQLPKSYKKLRIEMPPQPDTPPGAISDISVCHRCGFKARSRWELDGHVAAVHMSDLSSDEGRDAIMKGLKNDTNGRRNTSKADV